MVTIEAKDNHVSIPENASWIKIIGELTHLVIPEHVTYVECYELGLETIDVHDNVEFLYCNDNLLSELTIPSNLLCLHASHNMLKKIKCRGKLTRLFSFSINNNLIEDLDIELPHDRVVQPLALAVCACKGRQRQQPDDCVLQLLAPVRSLGTVGHGRGHDGHGDVLQCSCLVST